MAYTSGVGAYHVVTAVESNYDNSSEIFAKELWYNTVGNFW